MNHQHNYLIILPSTAPPPPTITVDDVEQQLQVVLGLLHQVPRLNNTHVHKSKYTVDSTEKCNQVKVEKNICRIIQHVLYQLVPVLSLIQLNILNQPCCLRLHIYLNAAFHICKFLASKTKVCGFKICVAAHCESMRFKPHC